MASFSEEDGILRIPATSPCRRDYQLRSDCDSSRPQSPWLPRSQSQQREEILMSPFRLYEATAGACSPIDRPNARSGTLPNTSRSWSSPLPNPSPLPSYFTNAAVATRSSRQTNPFVGRLPSGRSEEPRPKNEEAPEVAHASHMRSSNVSPSVTNWKRRNCVSGELGRTTEVAQGRKCKSGEIVGLEIRPDGIFPIPESRKEEPKSSVVVRKHRPSGSILWEAMNDADNELSKAIVPISYKWNADANPAVAAPAMGGSAVPFQWEVAPGKPKEKDRASADVALAPQLQLQLPPRLASAASLKRNSWSSSSPPPHRARSLSASLSSSVAKLGKQQSRRSVDEAPPSPRAPRPRGLSQALSQFGTPQYQCADYTFCEDSASSHARSPTSTLYGPGTPTSSSSSSSSRKPSTSFSHSVDSFDRWSYGDHATSRHSYTESQGDDPHEEHHPVDGTIVKLRKKLTLKSSKPPRSPRAPVRTPSRNGYSSQEEQFFDCHAHPSSASPSPHRTESRAEYRTENLAGNRAENRAEVRVGHAPSDTEEEAEPATRLPYKMPSPAREVEPPSSPTRVVPEFTSCLAFPRFLSKSENPPAQWTVNPSWNAPRDGLRDVVNPSLALEDGYRSPAYKATLELLSPSPDLLSKRSLKLRSPSSRRRHPHLVEVLCNSLKQSLQRCTKRSVARTHSITLYDDQFTKRHQSFMW